MAVANQGSAGVPLGQSGWNLREIPAVWIAVMDLIIKAGDISVMGKFTRLCCPAVSGVQSGLPFRFNRVNMCMQR